MLQYNYLSLDQSDVIVPENTVRDLGVIFNREGNFNNHISCDLVFGQICLR